MKHICRFPLVFRVYRAPFLKGLGFTDICQGPTAGCAICSLSSDPGPLLQLPGEGPAARHQLRGEALEAREVVRVAWDSISDPVLSRIRRPEAGGPVWSGPVQGVIPVIGLGVVSSSLGFHFWSGGTRHTHMGVSQIFGESTPWTVYPFACTSKPFSVYPRTSHKNDSPNILRRCPFCVNGSLEGPSGFGFKPPVRHCTGNPGPVLHTDPLGI